jgi:HTH-type transcriptional regulator / antitoxin HigA
MNKSPILNLADHKAALERIDQIWGAVEGTAEAHEFSVLVDLVWAYEEEHFPISLPTPDQLRLA